MGRFSQLEYFYLLILAYSTQVRKEQYSEGIFPGAMAGIIFTGACIMQNKQAFATTQAAPRLGITQKMELQTSEGITDMMQTGAKTRSCYMLRFKGHLSEPEKSSRWRVWFWAIVSKELRDH